MKFLLPFLALSLDAQTQAGPPAPTLPGIAWVATGPSYDGSRVGASVAASVPVKDQMSLWGVVDWTFAHGKPTQSFAPGFAFKALAWTWGKTYFRVDLLTLGGVTSTPTATLGSFQGGAHAMVCRGGFCFGGAERQLTNPADAKRPRLYNIAAEWRFGGVAK